MKQVLYVVVLLVGALAFAEEPASEGAKCTDNGVIVDNVCFPIASTVSPNCSQCNQENGSPGITVTSGKCVPAIQYGGYGTVACVGVVDGHMEKDVAGIYGAYTALYQYQSQYQYPGYPYLNYYGSYPIYDGSVSAPQQQH